MKNISVLLFLMAIAMNSSAQRYFYKASNEKWGLKSRSGSIILSPRYDETLEDAGTLFVGEEIIGVKRGNLWGLVDKAKGREIVSPRYQKMSPFIYGFAIVLKNGKQGFINYSGEEVVPLIYEDASVFSGTYLAAVKKNGRWGYIDTLGKVRIPFQYDEYSDFDKKGKAKVSFNGKDIYINTKGAQVSQYDNTGAFSEGLALVKISGIINDYDRYGYINKSGKEVIPIKYSRGKSFSDGVAAVKKGNKWGYINHNGETIVPFDYDGAEMHRNGIAIVEKNNKTGGIDNKGKMVIPLDYDWIQDFSSTVTMVELDGKVGFINTSARVVIPIKYDDAVRASENIISVQSGDQWGILDTKGNFKSPVTLDYDELEECHEGLIRVMKVDKYGFINTSGKLVIPLRYDYAGRFVNDTVIVKRNENWGAINKKEETVVPFKFKGSAIGAAIDIENYLKNNKK